MPWSAAYVGSSLGFGTEPIECCTAGLQFWLFYETKSILFKKKNATKLCLGHYFCTDKCIMLRSSRIEKITLLFAPWWTLRSLTRMLLTSLWERRHARARSKEEGSPLFSAFGYVRNSILPYSLLLHIVHFCIPTTFGRMCSIWKSFYFTRW